jgi:glycogen synthase
MSMDAAAVAILPRPVLPEPPMVRKDSLVPECLEILRHPGSVNKELHGIVDQLHLLRGKLDESPLNKAEALRTFYALPQNIKAILATAVWKAYGEPLGDLIFGDHAIEADVSVLGKLRTTQGEGMIDFLTHEMETLLLCHAWDKVLSLVEGRSDAVSCEKIVRDLALGFSGVQIPPSIDYLTILKQGIGYLKKEIDPENIRKRVLSPTVYPVRASSREAVLARSLTQTDPSAPKRVLMVSYELSKVYKYGGLAEAVYGIGKNLVERGHQVDVIMPKLDALPAALERTLEEEDSITQMFKGAEKTDRVFRTALDGMTVHLVEDTPDGSADHKDHFKIGGMGNFYEDGPLARPDAPWFALKERMAYFGSSVASFVEAHADEYDAVVFQDWHGAWAIDLLARRNLAAWTAGELPAMGLVVHNNNYGCQGIYGGVETEIPALFGEDKEGMSVMLKAMTWADHVVTVSPTFAMEMQGSTLGAGIEERVRDVAERGRLTGILNGSNPDLWNPQTDATLKNWKDPETGEAIDLTYDPTAEDVFDKKRLIQEQLQKWITIHHPEWIEETGIDVTKGETILYVGRYDSSQKGLDKFSPAMQQAHQMGANFVCMGIASPKDTKAHEILDALQAEAAEMKDEEGGKGLVIRDERNAEGKLDVQQGSSTVSGVGSLFRAVATFTYFPSEFEPCGLVQFEGWLMGALAIASKTGGLADTVIDDPASPFFNGFTFERCADWHSDEQTAKVKETVEKAILFWRSLDIGQKREAVQKCFRFAKQSSWTSSPTGEASAIDQHIAVLDRMAFVAQRRSEGFRAVSVK